MVVLAALVRVPGINRPLLGHFATKNAMYAMIARNWVMGRAPFWRPTTDCMAGGDRGWHLLEIPMAAYLAGAGWAVCGGSLDLWGRAVSIAFSAAGVTLLFLLVRRWHTLRAAWAAALVLAFSPLSIIFGQSFMLESSIVFFMLACLWCMETWLATGCKRWFALTALSLALLLCTKIYMIVMLLPLAALAVRKVVAAPGAAQRRQWLVASTALLVIGVAPAAAWCMITLRLGSPENPLSAHVYHSLYRSTAVHQASVRLLASVALYWRLFANLAGAGLTPVGLLLAGFGLFHPAARRHASWLAAMALLVMLLPGKFFELRYYTLVLVPAAAVLAGLGCERLSSLVERTAFRWNAGNGMNSVLRVLAACCLLVGVACSLRLAVGPAFITPPEDRAVLAAAAAAREVSAADEPVATLHGAGCDLLYYCDRPGWALSVNDRRFPQTLDRCRQQGARWLVVADLASLESKPSGIVLSTLPVVCEGEDYRVYRLEERDKIARQSPSQR